MREPYQTLDDVRYNDATVHNMTARNCTLTEIVIQLANEKAQLLNDLVDARTRNAAPIILQTDKNLTLTPRQPHIPQIHPHTPQ